MGGREADSSLLAALACRDNVCWADRFAGLVAERPMLTARLIHRNSRLLNQFRHFTRQSWQFLLPI